MTETERSDEAVMSTEATSDTPALDAVAAAPDPAQFLEQLSAQALPEAEAALKALVAEKPGEALPLLQMAAQKGSLALSIKAMDALAALHTQDAADALAALGADRSDAQKAKEARRALHKLNLAGIKAVAITPAAEPGTDKVYACMASPVDGSGTRTLTVVRQNRFDTLSMAVFFLNEKNGVVDAQGAIPCSMSVWKRYLADASTGEMTLIPVELAFCQTQLELAVARNERSKTSLPERYFHLSTLVSGPSELRARPAQLDPETIMANPDLIAKTSGLFQLPECKTWLFTFEEVRPYALKVIAEARRQQANGGRKDDLPVLDLNEVQREGAVVSITMNALFDGARRSIFQERLEYTADLLWRSDRLDEAQWAMAAALALAPESTLPVDQHPFLRDVTLQSLSLGVQVEQAGVSPEAIARGTGGATAQKKDEPDEYVDAEGLIRRKSGLIIPR